MASAQCPRKRQGRLEGGLDVREFPDGAFRHDANPARYSAGVWGRLAPGAASAAGVPRCVSVLVMT